MTVPSMDVRYRWTENDRKLANTPKDQIVTEEGKDPPTVTAYGIHPQEQRTMLHVKSKTQKRVAEMLEGDEVMVPLAYSTSGMEGRASRFFRAGYTWEKLEVDGDGKPKIGAATLGELCNALYKSDKNRYHHYDLSNPAEAWDFPRRCWKIFDYWDNTDYRYAVVKSGKFAWNMDPLQIPTEAPDPDDPSKTQRCLYVLGKIPEKKDVNAAPSGKDGAKNTNAAGAPSTPTYFEDPDPPFDILDPELRETLKRSFRAKMLNYPGGTWVNTDGSLLSGSEEAKHNLANAWGNANGAEIKTLTQALDWIATGLMNIVVRLFDRIKGIDPTMELWRQIKYIRNAWGGGSAGFKVVYFDPVKLRQILDNLVNDHNGKKMARDRLIGSLDHQYGNVYLAYPKAQILDWFDSTDPPPDVDTWREVDVPGQESVHISVDKVDMVHDPRTLAWTGKYATRHVGSDDIHIDWKSPVKGINPTTKRCEYEEFFKNAAHVAQAKWGIDVPEDRFVGMYRRLERLKAGKEKMKDDAAFGPEVDALDKEWQDNKWRLSLTGKTGFDGALPYVERAHKLTVRLATKEAEDAPPPPAVAKD